MTMDLGVSSWGVVHSGKHNFPWFCAVIEWAVVARRWRGDGKGKSTISLIFTLWLSASAHVPLLLHA